MEYPAIPVEEARSRADYFRTIYQRSVWKGDCAEAIANDLGVRADQVVQDDARIRKTLHAGDQSEFLCAIDGFRGFKLTLHQ